MTYEVIGTNDDPDWAQRRLEGVGASEAAMMLGEDPRHGGGGPALLWAYKTGQAEPDDLSDIEAIQWGHVMEPVIIAQYGSKRYANRPVRVSREQLRSVEHPWAMCTKDGETEHPKHGWVPLEAKNVGSYQAERWVEGVPVEMWWQLQHQMLVCGTPVASIAACVGGNSLWWEDVERDERAQNVLKAKGAAFWQCVVERRVPLHVPTLHSVKALYPAGDETGEVQLSGPSWVDVDARLEFIKSEQKRLRSEREDIEARIGDAIGRHASASLDNGVTYTRRTQERAAYMVEAAEYRVLRRRKPRGK